MITRQILASLKDELFKGKAILLLGARQVGKSTLVKTLLAEFAEDALLVNLDDLDSREEWQNTTTDKLRNMLGSTRLVVFDEAQRIENIGITIKQIVDNIPSVQVIATGSSSFDLAGRVNEPLTGRKFEHLLFPFSFQELSQSTSVREEGRLLSRRLVFGAYPDIVNHPGTEQKLLRQLSSSYLFRDLLGFEGIKRPPLLEKLIRMLALQIGSEVSYEELGRQAGADKGTVERYIDLMEKAFIVFKLSSFSRNIRNEIKKGKKIYFYDNGIRNSVIGDFTEFSNRSDRGALWENYLVSERKKLLEYNEAPDISYFWRTSQQQEVDYIEQRDGKLYAWEFKWQASGSKLPLTFLNAYQEAIPAVIDSTNYQAFLSKV